MPYCGKHFCQHLFNTGSGHNMSLDGTKWRNLIQSWQVMRYPNIFLEKTLHTSDKNCTAIFSSRMLWQISPRGIFPEMAHLLSWLVSTPLSRQSAVPLHARPSGRRYTARGEDCHRGEAAPLVNPDTPSMPFPPYWGQTPVTSWLCRPASEARQGWPEPHNMLDSIVLTYWTNCALLKFQYISSSLSQYNTGPYVLRWLTPKMQK